MAKRVTLSIVYDALLQLAGAIEAHTIKSDARWESNEARWNQNDARWDENALLLSNLNRRVTNVEIDLADFRTETRAAFARLERRLEAVEAQR